MLKWIITIIGCVVVTLFVSQGERVVAQVRAALVQDLVSFERQRAHFEPGAEWIFASPAKLFVPGRSLLPWAPRW